ncbi:MAG: DNA-processing protein DprA [Candidatus Coatesbacteria bacterium]|nr:DNA-processing protein DprA [Candidatus Coatesbacteria bacterium]
MLEHLRSRPLIAVIGASKASREGMKLAEETGHLIAENGCVLLCGGMDGIMLHAAKGAFKAGGLTVGILPGLEHSAANKYIQLALPTGLGHIRNALLVTMAQAVIAIEGGFGTLSEISFSQLRLKPLALLRSWPDIRELDLFRVDTPKEAMEKVLIL